MRHSDCPSKTQGGELGWLERGQTTPEFDRQVFRLHEGLAGFPVESRWGYHVVSVDEVAPGEQLRSEEHTSELQSLMRISYAVFCLKKKKLTRNITNRRTYNRH